MIKPSLRLYFAGGATLLGAIGAGFFVYTSSAETVLCDGRQMTAAEVAAHRGIDPEMIEQLHFNRSLEVSEICILPQKRLERAISRVLNPKPDQPGEWAKLRMMQSVDESGRIPDDALVKAHDHLASMIAAQKDDDEETRQITRSSWTWIGPGNIGGRVRSIVIHPQKPNTMYLGSVSGGIWKTTNGGDSWKPLDDFMANLAVSTMLMDRENPDIIYAGTGEGFFNKDSILGAGIFKTTDAGATWKRLPSTNTPDFQLVNRLASSPDNKVILAATNTGIFRSTDGGKTWTMQHAKRVLDIDFQPDNNQRAIASSQSGQVWFSNDGGKNWDESTGIDAGGFNDRVEVAYAPSNGNIVYASSGFNKGTLYKSNNGGKSFAQVSTGKGYLGSQGWYDNAIWVDPTNPNILVVGGIDLWRSVNGGKSLTKISQWFAAPKSAHADHHIIVHHPDYNGTTNNTVFFGNDGGIYRANVKTVQNTEGWQDLNNNLGITQFYGAAGHPGTGRIIGGTQDNGTLFYKPTTVKQRWTQTLTGDGGFSAADPSNANYFYGEYIFLQIHRSTDGGVSANYIYSGIDDADKRCALFIAPFILDPNNSNRMLAGGCSLWRSNNVKATKPTWEQIKQPVPPQNGITVQISAIAVAPGRPNIIWVGYTNGEVWKTINGNGQDPTWTKVDSASLPNRYVTRIAVQEGNPDVVYTTYGGFYEGSSGNIWKSTNGGASWTNIHGSGTSGLPAVPIRSVVIHPTKPKWIYVGTELGIFVSKNGGNDWLLPHRGPTNASVDELFFMDTTIYAATHGRGVFKSPTLETDVKTAEGGETSETEAAGTANP